MGNRSLAHLRRVTAEADLDDGRYELLEEIGQGGMGTVYRARDRRLERDVALKILRHPTPSSELVERLRREALILARLEHPGIVPVHDAGVDASGRVWYAMKLVQGHSLAQEMTAHPTLPTRLRLFERVCEAVAFAHAQGVLHRDLKPSNVMIGAFGEVMVMDWGVAKLLDREPLDATLEPGELATKVGQTQSGSILGTPGYMAPEQAEGRSAEVDERSDVYALGRMLHELVSELPKATPRRLRSIVAKASALAPHERYPNVPELHADVRRFLDGDAVLAHRERPWERVGRFAVHNRTLLLLFGTYLLARIVVFLLSKD